MHSFSFPTNIILGSNSVNQILPILKKNSVNNCLIVTDNNIKNQKFFPDILNHRNYFCEHVWDRIINSNFLHFLK